jgi:hypothetical protein
VSKAPLYEKLYFQPVYPEVVRLIGYAGITPFAFWDAAKEKRLVEQYGKEKVMFAVCELTQYDLREQSDPRYELNAEARKWCVQLLGQPPEHPLHEFLKQGPPHLMGEDALKWESDYRAQLEPSKEEKPKRKRTKK